jgi:hypothetical protein
MWQADCTGCIADVETPGGDMWQVMWRTSRELDQSMGDTCHHCKGDTWHDMTSAVEWAGMVAGHMDHWSFDAW